MTGDVQSPVSGSAMNSSGYRPFFSIGVTTYDRPALLKETLESISRQTFSDFEVLVGNDNPRDQLSGEFLGIEDGRISFINRPSNLGELGNMNALLDASRGRYFTWLADDDLYAETFLEDVYSALVKYDPPVVYTSYVTGECSRFEETARAGGQSGRLLEGFTFLGEYLSHSLKAIGCYGVFRKECLQQLGGMEKLGNGFSPYSDNLLAIKSGTFDHVAYLDSPLLFFRTHDLSISYTSPSIDAYRSAQEALLAKCVPILTQASPNGECPTNLYRLLLWCIQDFDSVVRRAGAIRAGQALSYLAFVRRYLPMLKGTEYHRQAMSTVLRIFAKFLRDGMMSVGRRHAQ